MARPFVIGLTGNIATGKSLVMGMLRELGAVTIDADKLVHLLMRRGNPLFSAVVDEFGEGILNEDLDIERGELGRIVFADPAALVRLEAVTHPTVRRVVARLIALSRGPLVVVEAIKLIESGMAGDYDSIWVVTAPREVQVERLIANRGMSAADAVTRIDAQPPQAEKVARADVVIDNGGDVAETRRAVGAAFALLPIADRVPGQRPVHLEGQPDENGEGTPVVEVRRVRFAELAGLAERFPGLGVAEGGDAGALRRWFLSRGLFVALRAGSPVAAASLATRPPLATIEDVVISRAHMWPVAGGPLLDTLEEEGRQTGCELALLRFRPIADARALAFFRRNGYEIWLGPDLITVEELGAFPPARGEMLLVKRLWVP